MHRVDSGIKLIPQVKWKVREEEQKIKADLSSENQILNLINKNQVCYNLNLKASVKYFQYTEPQYATADGY